MSEFYVIGFSDGGSSVQCRGPASVLAYLRRGDCRVLSGDLAEVRRFEAVEHARVQAALDDATWRDVGAPPCR